MELPDLTDSSFSPTRRFIGQALRIPPLVLIEDMEFLPGQDPITTYADNALSAITKRVTPEDPQPVKTLGAAIEDMLHIGWSVRQRFNGSPDQSIELFSHPNTIAALVQLALEPTADTTCPFFVRLSPDKWQLDPSQTFIDTYAPSNTGGNSCPFAGYNKTRRVDPLFRKFVPWAGELSMRALTIDYVLNKG